MYDFIFSLLIFLISIVKSYFPSPLKGEGFFYISRCFAIVFHKTFDITPDAPFGLRLSPKAVIVKLFSNEQTLCQ